jgi:hypothetical protein
VTYPHGSFDGLNNVAASHHQEEIHAHLDTLDAQAAPALLDAADHRRTYGEPVAAVLRRAAAVRV